MVSALSTGLPMGYMGVSAYRDASSRIGVPVAPSQYLYSNFRNVHGVPASEGSRGVSISRLKIIDSIIEVLKQRGIKPAVESPGTEDNPANEYLIKELTEQMNRMQSAPTPYMALPQAKGMAFDIAV